MLPLISILRCFLALIIKGILAISLYKTLSKSKEIYLYILSLGLMYYTSILILQAS